VEPTGHFATENGELLNAALANVDGKSVADGGAFDSNGQLEHPDRVVLLDDEGATAYPLRCRAHPFPLRS